MITAANRLSSFVSVVSQASAAEVCDWSREAAAAGTVTGMWSRQHTHTLTHSLCTDSLLAADEADNTSDDSVTVWHFC